MSISSALTALQTDITNARSAITTKGGTVTSGGGSSQLATDIATIPTGITKLDCYGIAVLSPTSFIFRVDDDEFFSTFDILGLVCLYTEFICLDDSRLYIIGTFLNDGVYFNCIVSKGYLFEEFLIASAIYDHDNDYYLLTIEDGTFSDMISVEKCFLFQL